MIGKATVVESAGIIVFHESIQMERNAGIGSFDGDDNAIKPGRKECIEGTRPISTSPLLLLHSTQHVSRKKPIEIVEPFPLPSPLTFASLAFTSRHATKFILSRQGGRIDISRQSDKRTTRRLQPAARCNKWM